MALEQRKRTGSFEPLGVAQLLEDPCVRYGFELSRSNRDRTEEAMETCK